MSRTAEPAPARVLRRHAGRVLCVDPAGAVLLVGVLPPGAAAEDERVWLLPGGGCEPGESRTEAALRELAEETGLVVDPPWGEPVLAGRASTWRFVDEDGADVRVEQVEDWLAVRAPRFEPVLVVPGVFETADATTFRWADPAEVAALAARGALPAEVPDALARAHAELGPQQLRPSARVLLVDPDDRVLLMRSRTDAGDVLLYPVGGGVEPGETHEDAARREVAEETGLAVGALRPAWRRRHAGRLAFAGLPLDVDLRERWYWARVDAFEPARDGWEAAERRYVEDLAWFSPAELVAARARGWVLVPRDLDRLLPLLLAGRPPGEVGV